MYTSDDTAMQLGDYLAVLRRRWWLVAAVVLVTVASAVAFAMTRVPEYRAQADVAVGPFRQSEDASLQEVILGESTVNTERRVLTSRAVTDRVIEATGVSTTADELLEQVTVVAVNDTRVLEVRVVDTDPELAAEIANAYVNSYLDFRRDQAIDSLVAAQQNLNERRENLQQQLDRVQQQLDELAEPEPVVDPDSGLPTGEVDDPDEAEREALESERDSLLSQLTQLGAQAAQAEADAQLLQGGGQVLNPAEPPEQPVSPKPLRTGVLALMLGLMLGVGAAFLRDHFDDILRDEDDAKRAGRDLPVLGRIPHHDETGRLVTIVDRHSPHAEAYRGLSASVRFLLAARRRATFGDQATDDGTDSPDRGQSVLVTSPDPGDGKTATAANLAVAAARAGMRVILVDADMRRPNIHKRFGMPSGAGLSDVIAGDVDVLAVLVDIGVDNLRVLPAGTLPPNPSELLASPSMRSLGRFLCEGADIVVVDGPPVLAVSDTFEMAPNADAVLMVIRAGQSRRRTLQDSLERLDGVGATVSGLVVNDLDEKSSAYAYYSQAYEYQPRDGQGHAGTELGSRRPGSSAEVTSYEVSIRRGAGLPAREPSDEVGSTASDDTDDTLVDIGALFSDAEQ